MTAMMRNLMDWHLRRSLRRAGLPDLPEVRAAAGLPSFTCPRCGMTSPNPNDVREGYCGNCHDWTGEPR